MKKVIRNWGMNKCYKGLLNSFMLCIAKQKTNVLSKLKKYNKTIMNIFKATRRM